MSSLPEISPHLRSIIEAGRAAPSADNSQPWRFCWDGKNLSVIYDTDRVSGKTFGPEEHATLLAMGAVKENILQVTRSLEIDIKECPAESKHEYFRFAVPSSNTDFQMTYEHPVFQRHTNRWPFEQKPIPNHILEPLQDLTQGKTRVTVFTEREMIKRVAGWVRTTSEVRFQSQEVHEFLAQSLRFTAAEVNQGNGLDVRTLALPLGGKVFLKMIRDWKRLAVLNKVGFYKLLGLVEAHPISNSSALLLLTGPHADSAIIQAGMLMARVWIYLNSQGVAVQPYYVITDQLERLKAGKLSADLRPSIETLQAAIETLQGTDQYTVHMLFRIGYPKIQPLRSLRLPSGAISGFANCS